MRCPWRGDGLDRDMSMDHIPKKIDINPLSEHGQEFD